MIVIGLEGTAHTFGIGIINEKGKIFSDVRDVYTTIKGGMIPRDVAQHHRNVRDRIIKEAIEKSKQKKFDLVVYSRGPGLPPTLSITREVALDIAKEFNIPILGINHVVAHLTSSKLFNKVKDPVYLFTSGANTQVIALEGGKFRIFGETLDVGIGNALDKFGRIIGLGFPAGPKIEELAKQGKYIELPYSVKGMDVSFSGIVTKTQELFKKNINKEDLCYSMQENCFAMLTEVTERALAHCDKKEVVLIGGVAANKRFCEMLNIMCKERDAKFYTVPLEYAGDNGVMIGYQGLLEYLAGRREEKQEIKPYERVDDIKVFWK